MIPGADILSSVTLQGTPPAIAVSYTHLDVYKRQIYTFRPAQYRATWLRKTAEARCTIYGL